VISIVVVGGKMMDSGLLELSKTKEKLSSYIGLLIGLLPV
jgi:hypothetical protein